MQQISDGVWTVPAPLRFFGLRVNTRMTVCRLLDGGLALIAPVHSDDNLINAIAALGPVRAIIAPNLMHHLYVGKWMEAFPEARSFGPEGITAKRPDLTFDYALGPKFDQGFSSDLLRFPIAGMPRMNESLFLHRLSGTLIATDFCFFMPEAKGITGLFAWLTGIKRKTKCEPSFRLLIKDRAAFRDSLQPLWAVDVRHLSMCHHNVVSVDARDALEQVLNQLRVPQKAPATTPE